MNLFQISSNGKKMKHLVLSQKGNQIISEWWSSDIGGQPGKKQKTVDTILGKNQGKANETTDVEQCTLELVRKVQKKKDEGYSDSEEAAIAKTKVSLDISHVLPLEFAPAKPISKLPEKVDPFDGSWLAERKYDGVCVLLHNTGTEKIVYSRRMIPITGIVNCITDLKKKLDMVPSGSLFIGELIAYDKNGKENTKVLRGITSDKTKPEKAEARYDDLIQNHYTVEFHPYEVYFYQGRQVTDLNFTTRLSIVENTFNVFRGIKTFTKEMVQEARDKGWEGYILRQPDSTVIFTTNGKAKRKGGYKIKFLETTDCIVTGMSPGNGKHESRFARFQLAQYKDGELVSCGWAGPGQLGEKACDELTKEVLSWGYALEEIVLKEEDWFPVELEYQARQDENEKGQICFLFPVITRLRNDKPLLECEIE